ncbi:MAG: MurR/RpiR family transcriptional regulator [Hyphomicrobiales bacterium]
MGSNHETVYECLQNSFETLTRAERQLASVLLENWPVSGLGSITKVADSANVSTPTVARMIQKLGFSGYPSFQAALRDELEAKISNPIEKHERWSSDAPDTHILNRFADAILTNLRQSLSQINPDEFDRACALLANLESSTFVAGGRITHTLAEYLFLHLQMIRSDTTLISSSDAAWPHYMLDMKAGDVLVVLDVRRYQNDLLKLAEAAEARGVKIVLITDQWRSPVAVHATYTFSCRIEAPSAWDSNAALLVLLETIIAHVQTSTWDTTSARTEELEDLFDKTRLFRKFK